MATLPTNRTTSSTAEQHLADHITLANLNNGMDQRFATKADLVNGEVPVDQLPAYPTAVNGKSAYDVAIDNGFVGTQTSWLASLKGTDGTDGTDASQTIPTVSVTANTTFSLSHVGKVLENTAVTSAIFTVPPVSTENFPVGTVLQGRQYGTGAVVVTAGAGVTIRSRGAALTTAGQYSEFSLHHRSSNVWVLSGDMIA